MNTASKHDTPANESHEQNPAKSDIEKQSDMANDEQGPYVNDKLIGDDLEIKKAGEVESDKKGSGNNKAY